MAKYRITGPDGAAYEVNAPDTASEAEVLAYAQKNYAGTAAAQVNNDEISRSARASASEGASGKILSSIGGLVRGAGSIGATLTDALRGNLADPVMSAVPASMRPQVTGGLAEAPRGDALRKSMDTTLQGMGADPSSGYYMGGKLVSEIAGTAGAGGALAVPLRAAGSASPTLNAIASGLESGGFRIGNQVAGLPARAAMRGGTGAAVGAASTGLADPKDALLGAGVGAALPGAIKGGLRGVEAIAKGVRKVGGSVEPEVAALAKRADDLGINIPADRLANSKPLDALAAGLRYVPLSGRVATEDAMNTQLNRALSKTFGQDSPNVTAALRKADFDLGAKFDSFLKSNAVAVDAQFLDDLAEAANTATRELPTELAGVISKQVDEIVRQGESGVIEGQLAYNIKRTLDRIGKRNSPEAYYALDLKGKLMDALNRSVGPEQAEAFAQVRKQYAAMLQLQKLATNGVEGELSVARVANMKNINNPQLQELADISAQFVKPREGQHGAAQRAFAGLAALGLGGVPAFVAGAAGGRALNGLLNSRTTRGLLMEPTPQAMLESAKPLGLLGSAGYRGAPLLATQD